MNRNQNISAILPESETLRYQYSNHLGSACLELDGSADIISYEEYHPFGTKSYRSGRNEVDVSLKRYKYVGKERDEETGLYYYGARYYAAWIARFVSVDPLQHKYPYFSTYIYAGNKPITFVDFDGLGPSKRLKRRAKEYGEWYVKAMNNESLYSNPTYQIKGSSLFLYVEDYSVPGMVSLVSTEMPITRGNFGIFGKFRPLSGRPNYDEVRKWPHDVWQVYDWDKHQEQLEVLEILGIPVKENYTDDCGNLDAYSYTFAVVLFVTDFGDMLPNTPRRGGRKRGNGGRGGGQEHAKIQGYISDAVGGTQGVIIAGSRRIADNVDEVGRIHQIGDMRTRGGKYRPSSRERAAIEDIRQTVGPDVDIIFHDKLGVAPSLINPDKYSDWKPAPKKIRKTYE